MNGFQFRMPSLDLLKCFCFSMYTCKAAPCGTNLISSGCCNCHVKCHGHPAMCPATRSTTSSISSCMPCILHMCPCSLAQNNPEPLLRRIPSMIGCHYSLEILSHTHTFPARTLGVLAGKPRAQ